MTIRVLFKDCSFIDVENIREWEIDKSFDMFFLHNATHKIMIPRENVKAIGRLEDLPVF